VLAGVVDADAVVRLRRGGLGGRLDCRAGPVFEGRGVLLERAPGVRGIAGHDLRHRAGADQLPAGLAALRAEVDDPVAGADDVEVVLDHHQRVAGGDEAAEGFQQLGDVIEVQAGRRLVEEEQRPLCCHSRESGSPVVFAVTGSPLPRG
jgi:hypothetical protein